MSSIPKPVSGSKPCGAMSVAEERSRPKIWPLSRSLRIVQTSAAAPDTIGAEKLVPFRNW